MLYQIFQRSERPVCRSLREVRTSPVLRDRLHIGNVFFTWRLLGNNTKSPLEVQRLVEQWQRQLAGDAVSSRPR